MTIKTPCGQLLNYIDYSSHGRIQGGFFLKVVFISNLTPKFLISVCILGNIPILFDLPYRV